MAEQETVAKNTVTIEQSGPCKKKIIVEVPRQTIDKVVDGQYETLRKDVVLPGFRKGRAPRRLLEKRFGKETGEQIKLKLLSDASEAALKDNKLDVLGEPNIDHEKISLPADGPFKFDFEVEVRPEFELPSLEGIPVEKRKLEVTDAQIDREIELLQRWSGVWMPREPVASPRGEEGKIEPNDQVIADVALKVEGAEQQEKLENIEIFARHNSFVGAVPVENLDELLVGGRNGDVKKTTVSVPKTYFREEYRGKNIKVEITIKEVKWLKPAEMNEDFLKRLNIKDEKELRDGLRDRLQGRLEAEIRAEMAEGIYKYLLGKADFELPLDVVADQAVTVLRRQYASLLSRGLPRERIDEQMTQLQAASEQQAKDQLKTFFVMDKIADKLGIKVTEEEINGYIAQLAVQRKQRPERLREEMARDGSLAQFGLQIRDEKVVAKLLETAKITEVEAKKEKEPAEKPAKRVVHKEAAKEKEHPPLARSRPQADKAAASKAEGAKEHKKETPKKGAAKEKEVKKAEKKEDAKKHKTPVRKKKTDK